MKKHVIMSRKNLALPYGLFLVLFVVFPLLLILFYAFTDNVTGAFTLNNFIGFFSSSSAISTLFLSFALAALTTALCLLIGYPVAYILSKSKASESSILLMLFIMPMWINFVLRASAMKELLTLLGMVSNENSFINTLIGMVYDFLPFMILPLYTTLIKLDKSVLEAASDLGANPATVFTKVTVPLSMPGIVSGITMVFMPTMTCYVISDTLGLGNVTIIGKMIEDNFGTANNWNRGSAIAFILLLIIFMFMLVTGGFKNEEGSARGTGLW